MPLYTCLGPKTYADDPVTKNKVYAGRAGCGYDLTRLITLIPPDGKNYKVECPKCQNEGLHMKTPVGDKHVPNDMGKPVPAV